MAQIGFKTVPEIIALIRQFLSEEQSAFWDDDDLLIHVNDEQSALMEKILNGAPDYFDALQTINLVASTQEYDLAPGFVEMNYVEFDDASGDNQDRIILPLLRSQKRFSQSNVADISRTRYYIRRNKIGFSPIPSSARNVSAFYSRRLMPLHYGTATAGAASTITFPSTPTVGVVSNINDFYNFETIYIISGTGAGQIREISDYVGSTRVATVSEAWTTQPDSTSVYSLISEIPPEHQQLLAFGAAIRALAKASQKETPSALKELYANGVGVLEAAVEERQVQEPRYVNYLPHAEDD